MPLALNYIVPASQTLLFPDPRPLVERLGRDFFRQLTERPGVYLMRDAQENILYVGKAKNLRKRLCSYRVANPERLARRHLRLLRAVTRIEVIECPDEAAALAREAEMLLTLKPKFNRAGVWMAKPRFLIWQADDQRTALAISETPAAGWQAFGPFGSGAVHLRAALARLLWYAVNPAAGSTTMPEGWMHGRLGLIAVVEPIAPVSSEIEPTLAKLFTGETESFVSWIGERTKPLVHTHDLAMRDADLETVASFMETFARRRHVFAAAGLAVEPEQSDEIQLFEERISLKIRASNP